MPKKSATLDAPNLFDLAAARAQAGAGKTAKPETVWTFGDGSVSDDITTFVGLAAQLDTLQTRVDEYKARLKSVGDVYYFTHISEHGSPPPPTVRMVAASGKSIGYVSQDRSNSFELKSDAHADLVDLLGKKQVDAITELRTSYAFDPKVLAEKARTGTVAEVVASTLTHALEKHVKVGLLTQDQVDRLLVCRPSIGFRPGLFERLIGWARGSAESLSRCYAAVGSASTRFVKS